MASPALPCLTQAGRSLLLMRLLPLQVREHLLVARLRAEGPQDRFHMVQTLFLGLNEPAAARQVPSRTLLLRGGFRMVQTLCLGLSKHVPGRQVSCSLSPRTRHHAWQDAADVLPLLTQGVQLSGAAWSEAAPLCRGRDLMNRLFTEEDAAAYVAAYNATAVAAAIRGFYDAVRAVMDDQVLPVLLSDQVQRQLGAPPAAHQSAVGHVISARRGDACSPCCWRACEARLYDAGC